MLQDMFPAHLGILRSCTSFKSIEYGNNNVSKEEEVVIKAHLNIYPEQLMKSYVLDQNNCVRIDAQRWIKSALIILSFYPAKVGVQSYV